MTWYRTPIALLALLTFALTANAQVDTEFWFAPPEVTSGHGDSPIYLRLSTVDKPAVVKVILPARGVVLATVTIAANTTSTIDLSQHKANLETIAAAAKMNTGLRIESTAPVTAYYEVGATWNSDIFALKGRNALGNRFVVGGQNFYHNSSDYYPLPSSSVDIVATRNHTVVKVRPTKPIQGHANDTLIIIKLNAGETYSLRKAGTSAANNPIGMSIESNKPIAVTIKDDSVINGPCRDLLGDQIVPVDVAGTEYVVMDGYLDNAEYIFVTAIEDNTDVFFAGNNVPAVTLQAGEVYRHQLALRSTYVLASKPVYVFHVTGFGCEMGMAILPSITCKGSTQIGFARTTNEFFGLTVLVRKEGIGHFKLNGSTQLLTAAAFLPVEGTGDKWYTAQVSYGTESIAVGQATLITNEVNSFQLGIINGNATSTCRYGYFSAFSTLFIGDDFTLCEGENAVLDAGPDKEAYLWSSGETTQQINVTGPGEYWVRVEREECVLYDTISLDLKKGSLNLGPDVALCPGETSNINGKENFSWEWSDGSTNQFLETTVPGKYWASVIDYNGCHASDTVMIQPKQAATIDLGSDVLKCPETELAFDISFPGATYLWSDGKTTAQNVLTEPGTYSASVFLNGCETSDEILITNLEGPPQDTIYGSPSVCPFSEAIAYSTDPLEKASFDWYASGGTIIAGNGNHVTVDWNDTRTDAVVKLVVMDSLGCKGDTVYYPVRINANLVVELPEGPDTLCLNKAVGVPYTTPITNGSMYNWQTLGGSVVSGQGTNNVTIDWTEGLHALSIVETSTTVDTVCQGESPVLKVFVFRDTTTLGLQSVSVDTVDAATIHLRWSYSGTGDHSPVMLFKKSFMNDWQQAETMTPDDDFADAGNQTMETPYSYFISLVNACDETVETTVHTTMLLTGNADSTNNMILLQWTPYAGWQAVSEYQVWRRVDDDAGLRLFASVPGNETQFIGDMAAAGFDHRYVVRGVGTNAESWSNPVMFTFEHPVTVPNVFTPNGDGWNDFFSITNIVLYKHSSLTILDRWGKIVYDARGYKNDWNGDGLAGGVYYYTLSLDADTQFKGLVSILR